LIVNNKLEIKIAKVPQPGIHHEKIGIFSDSNGDSLSFSGSINETWSGWTANSEEFKVFKSWDDSSNYFNADLKNFEELWTDSKENVEVFSLPSAVENKILSYSDDYSIESLEKNIELIKSTQELKILSGFEKKIEITSFSNVKADKKQLMDHQIDVINSWVDNKFFGIIKHATGSGKTFTGINAIKKWLENHNIVIVLVPSVLLLEQWIDEIEEEIIDVDIIKAGGGVPKKNWSSLLRFLTSRNNTRKTIVVSTIPTALTKDFKKTVLWSPDILLVVDEVHNMGSPKAQTFLDVTVGAALGLSATPERSGDEEGTEAIFNFFGKVLTPEFSITDAIDCGRLVPYIHEPFEIILSPEEEEEYSKLSFKISKIYSMIESGNHDSDLKQQLELLLFARAKIIKKAENKIPAALEILKNNYKEGEHWLVYCQDSDHLKTARNFFKSQGIRTLEYMSSMSGDRKSTLDYFKENGGILVAIKCLDEGIDIPYLQHAIILSSSQNPREHIQRRGRVLRKSKNKNLATIYDALVLTSSDLNDNQEQIMLTELKRAYNFSKDAYNLEAKTKILKLAQKYSININDLRDLKETDKILEEE
jgi:superfamily II DNA or RNA helicase